MSRKYANYMYLCACRLSLLGLRILNLLVIYYIHNFSMPSVVDFLALLYPIGSILTLCSLSLKEFCNRSTFKNFSDVCFFRCPGLMIITIASRSFQSCFIVQFWYGANTDHGVFDILFCSSLHLFCTIVWFFYYRRSSKMIKKFETF